MIYGQRNPYSYTAPVSDPTCFMGRSKQLSRCREVIEKRGCLSLVGGPRSGLTSLLQRLASPNGIDLATAPGDRVHLLYIDCRLLPNPRDLETLLLKRFTRGASIPKAGPWQALFGPLIRVMDTLLDNSERVVLLLDDFEAMGGNHAYVEFLDRFRALTPHAQMTLITATHTSLKSCCHMNVAESPLPNMFSVEYLGALGDDEADELINLASRVSQVDLSAHREDILALSGQMPYLLQMVCWRLYEAEINGETIDREMLLAFLLQEAEPVFTAIWCEASEEEREILRSTCVSSTAVKKTELIAKGYVNEDMVCSQALATFMSRMV